MVLTEEFEKMIHLIAQAIARTHGAEDAAPFADTVLGHAKVIAGEMTTDAPTAYAPTPPPEGTQIDAATGEALSPITQ